MATGTGLIVVKAYIPTGAARQMMTTENVMIAFTLMWTKRNGRMSLVLKKNISYARRELIVSACTYLMTVNGNTIFPNIQSVTMLFLHIACPKDWKNLKLNAVIGCYKLFTDEVSWDNAEHTCEKYKAHLASIRSEDEQTMVVQVRSHLFNKIP